MIGVNEAMTHCRQFSMNKYRFQRCRVASEVSVPGVALASRTCSAAIVDPLPLDTTALSLNETVDALLQCKHLTIKNYRFLRDPVSGSLCTACVSVKGGGGWLRL